MLSEHSLGTFPDFEVLIITACDWSISLDDGNSFDSATFSPDGSKIVSESGTKVSKSRYLTVRVWFGDQFEQSINLKGHGNRVRSATFSPDGSKIVSASDDNTVRVWFGQRFQESITLEGHGNPVKSATFSPDGSKIVSVSDDNILRVWFGERFQESITLEGHRDRIFSATFSPDGSKIVSASDDKILRVWFGERFQEYKIFSVPVNPTVRVLSEEHDFNRIEGRMRILNLPSRDFGIPKMISRLLDQWIPNSSDTA